MSHHHYIYVSPESLASQDDECFITVHHLVGYCPQTLEYYQQMAKLLKRSFPTIDLKSVGCHHVTHSDRVKGFTLVAVQFEAKKADVGLPNAAEWAKLVKKNDEDKHSGEHPHLKPFKADGKDWHTTAYRIDYNY